MADDDQIVPVDGPGVGELVRRREIDPRALAAALRALQERLPELVQLSLREKQSLARAASLDPAVIDRGVELGASFARTKQVFGWSSDEMRGDIEHERDWAELERVAAAFLESVRSRNLQRRHRIGSRMLLLYAVVGARLRGATAAEDAHLRPYYEEMKRAMLASRKKSKKK
jgi:hypothetical protein